MTFAWTTSIVFLREPGHPRRMPPTFACISQRNVQMLLSPAFASLRVYPHYQLFRQQALASAQLAAEHASALSPPPRSTHYAPLSGPVLALPGKQPTTYSGRAYLIALLIISLHQ